MMEDNVLIALIIQDYLYYQYGYAAVCVTIIQAEAISMVQERCPDLTTLVNRLEDGSGVEAIRRICHETAIPVISLLPTW